MSEEKITPSLESVWDYPHPHTLEIDVQPEHIDGLLHTNNTVYIGWCEQVAWNHSASLGLDLERYQALNRAMAITHCEYDYLQASREGDRLIAGTWIVDWDKRLSMRRCFQIIRMSDSATLLRGDVQFVCIALDTGRPKRLPPEFISGYGAVVLDRSD
ncbi:MAG: acyl-CoA thioesterase [Halioglobus sp.]